MATVQVSGEQRILLHDVSWQTYETLLKEFDERPIRLTYDRGELEIMTLSHEHEYYGKMIARFLETMTEELNIPIHSGRSTTFRREDEERGLEPDECYWIKHERAMRGKRHFDSAIDPPPDLAIEVEISRSALGRMAIYASLGVSEIWRFDGETLRVYRLGRNGKYSERSQSPTFPDLRSAEILRFLQMSETEDETSVVRAFRAWVREHLLPARQQGQPTPSTPRGRKPRKTK